MTDYHSYFFTRYGVGVVSASDLGVTGVELPDVTRCDTDSHQERYLL